MLDKEIHERDYAGKKPKLESEFLAENVKPSWQTL
jgi:hypothetical protein